MVKIEIATIQSTSATLAELMRSCALHAGLSRSEGGAPYVLSNPKAWLGIAYHSVLEKIAQADVTNTPVDVVAALLWDEAIASQYARAAAHPLDCRYGPPPTWPGYHLARASALLRAQEMAARIKQLGDANTPILLSIADPTIRERKFTAFGGRLVGRPDVIRTKEIIDYKTGGVTEYDDGAQADVVRASYVRQLRIYGYLIKQTLGWWPERGVLLPMSGPGVEVTLTAGDCEREAAEVVGLLDAYNAKMRGGADPTTLATPSSAACKWCPYKTVCTSFWKYASPEWSGSLDGAAVEGLICETPRKIHDGAAVAITIEIERGTEPRHRIQIAPLNPTIHTAVTDLVKGERVRLTGLHVRPDGALTPAQRTVVTPVGAAPIVCVS